MTGNVTDDLSIIQAPAAGLLGSPVLVQLITGGNVVNSKQHARRPFTDGEEQLRVYLSIETSFLVY